MIDRIQLWPNGTAEQLILLVAAFVLSAVIGLERQRRLKSAGLRTHVLVGLGAAVFTLVSGHGFASVLGDHVVLDPSRIAAQVVSGIGFLGAGVIFVRRNAVNGLTTAASIWLTAAVGMACGAGLPVLAVGGTVLYLIATVLLTPLGQWIRDSMQRDEICQIEYEDGRGVLRDVLAKAAELGFESTLSGTRSVEGPGGTSLVEARLSFRGRLPLRNLVEELSELEGVMSVQLLGADD